MYDINTNTDRNYVYVEITKSAKTTIITKYSYDTLIKIVYLYISKIINRIVSRNNFIIQFNFN